MTVEQQIYNIIDTPNTYIGDASYDVDNCQWIAQAGGGSLVHFNRDTYDYVDYSVSVRNKSNKVALEIIKTIYDKLKNYAGESFSIIISRLPSYLGKDDKNRVVYTCYIQYQLGGY